MPFFKETEELDERVEVFDVADEFDEEVEAPTGDFTIDGKSYIICFTKNRLEMYERSNKPIMASFIQNGGAFSISELKSLLSYGLRLEGGPFVNPRRGVDMASGLIEENGYLAVYERVTEALERDCGFLFKGANNEA